MDSSDGTGNNKSPCERLNRSEDSQSWLHRGFHRLRLPASEASQHQDRRMKEEHLCSIHTGAINTMSLCLCQVLLLLIWLRSNVKQGVLLGEPRPGRSEGRELEERADGFSL